MKAEQIENALVTNSFRSGDKFNVLFSVEA